MERARAVARAVARAERSAAAKGLEPFAAASTGAELRLTAKNLSKKAEIEAEIEGAKAAGGHLDEAAREAMAPSCASDSSISKA
eukprot:jgi/Chrpa1/3696/Chrysochromulina_OHIO_Genome00015616-RA